MKQTVPGGSKYAAIKAKLRQVRLHTVCEAAKCPNLGECGSGGETGTGTANVTILGDICTRGCMFCNAKASRTPPLPDPDEPSNVAEAIASWGLDYVVITSVDRDDLADQESNHFAETYKLKALKPDILIEALESCEVWIRCFCSHHWTVEELQSVVRDHRANFNSPLKFLKWRRTTPLRVL